MKYVAYYRVSTKQQGNSGLGLEAQKSAVMSFIRNDESMLAAEFSEIESGKNDDRVGLADAIDFCKKNKATLLIAKLDRLSRNAAFIFKLKDSKIDFTCCDLPEANTLTIGIFATLAQHERELISKRTKAALQALKDRGVKLGKPENLTKEGRDKAHAANRIKAANNENNKRALAMVCEYKKQGMTLQAIADKLNNAGFKSSTGKAFQRTTVNRLLKRCA
jgi:DNA invertase Pin-like site-specific DNA recombinase